MCTEGGKALKEMASAMRSMTKPSSAMEIHVHNFNSATEQLKTVLTNVQLEKAAAAAADENSVDILQLITMTSVLIQIIKCVENISVSVLHLSNQARFSNNTCQKSQSPSPSPSTPPPPPPHHQLLHRGVVNPVADVDSSDHVVIDIACNTTSHEKNESQHVGPT